MEENNMINKLFLGVVLLITVSIGSYGVVKESAIKNTTNV